MKKLLPVLLLLFAFNQLTFGADELAYQGQRYKIHNLSFSLPQYMSCETPESSDDDIIFDLSDSILQVGYADTGGHVVTSEMYQMILRESYENLENKKTILQQGFDFAGIQSYRTVMSYTLDDQPAILETVTIPQSSGIYFLTLYYWDDQPERDYYDNQLEFLLYSAKFEDTPTRHEYIDLIKYEVFNRGILLIWPEDDSWTVEQINGYVCVTVTALENDSNYVVSAWIEKDLSAIHFLETKTEILIDDGVIDD